MLPDAIKTQSLELARESASGSFAPGDTLRATLVTIDLDALAPAIQDALIGQLGGDDLAALGIDGQVQLSPGSVPRRFSQMTNVDSQPVLSMSRCSGP